MKRITVIMLALLTLGLATTATAASDPRVPSLQRRVAALTTQVSTLTTVVNKVGDLNTCKWTYQSHINYAFLNIFEVMIGQPQTPDTTPSDNGACARAGMQPPTTRYLAVSPRSPFQTLPGLLAAMVVK